MCSDILWLEMCVHVQGKRDDTLGTELTSMSNEERARAVNNLLQKKRLLIFRDEDGVLRYKPVSSDEAQLFKGLSREDQVVYDVIKSSGNRGMWTKDLRERSELSQNQVTRSLQALEKKELIKSVRSVTNKNRKVYMLAHLTPSEEVTGGQWYTDEQFDADYIDVVRKASYRAVIELGFATVEQVHATVEQYNVSHDGLSAEHIQQVLNALHLDGYIERWFDDGNGTYSIPVEHFRPNRREVCCTISHRCFHFALMSL